jgi:hypothetical protein
MRDQTYRLFEIVAWPAAGWGTVELALRAGAGFGQGANATLITTVMAALTIVASRQRRRALAAANTSADD